MKLMFRLFGLCILVFLPMKAEAKDIVLPEAGISFIVPDDWQVIADRETGEFNREVFEKVFYFRGQNNKNRVIALCDPATGMGMIVLAADPPKNYAQLLNSMANADQATFDAKFATVMVAMFESNFKKLSQSRGFSANDFSMQRRPLDGVVTGVIRCTLQRHDVEGEPEVQADSVLFMERIPGTMVDFARERDNQTHKAVLDGIVESIRLIPKTGD